MSERVSKYLQKRIDAGDFPSAVYLVGRRGKVMLSGALGYAVKAPEVIPAGLDTIYDLASLTKPLISGLLTALFIERGLLSLDHRVSVFLAEFETDGKRMITIGDLVAHTSPLPSWLPLYLLVSEPADIIDHIAKVKVTYGEKTVVYGDPNFIVLGAILERISGLSIDRLAIENIFRPLSLTDTFFNPSIGLKRRIAASEAGNVFERETCISQGYDLSANPEAFRTDVIWGRVHDGNCWFMDGVSGHAGLFSTVSDVYLLAQQFLANSTSILRPETCGLFTEDLTSGMNEARSLAFQLARTPQSTAGPQMSPSSFGHLGFTGTSVWIDPQSETVFILLTNRTHLVDPPFVNINSIRRNFHVLAAEELNNK